MAEAYFNKLAGGELKAFSAGTQPSDKVYPVVVEVMKEVGIDISGNKSKMLTMDLVEKADLMITMGCGADAEAICPASFMKTEDWALDDPYNKSIVEARKIRDEVKTRVIELIQQLTSKQKE
jgi:protein-tyrosine-phosphatase